MKVVVDGMASDPDELWINVSRKTTVPDLYVIADKVELPTVSLLGWCYAAELLCSSNRRVAGGGLFFVIRRDRLRSLHELKPQ